MRALLILLPLLLWPVSASADLQRTVIFDTSPGSTGTQEYSFGFRARFIRITAHVDTSAGLDANAVLMNGCAAETSGGTITQWVNWGYSADASASGDGARQLRNDRAIHLTNSAGTAQTSGEVTTWGATSVTVTWHTATTQRAIVMEAFGGTDLTDASCSTFAFPSSTNATFQVTSLAFQPKFLLLAGGVSGAINTHQTNHVVSIGATDGTNQWVISATDEDASTAADSYVSQRTDLIHQALSITNGTPLRVASFTSFLSNGFQLNVSTADGTTPPVGFLAVDGTALFAVGALSAPLTEGITAVTGLSFEPTAFEFFSTGYDASTSIRAHYQIAHGFQIGTETDERAALTATSQDAADPTVAKSFYSTSLALSIRDTDGTDTAGYGDMTVTSIAGNGFTTTWTNLEDGFQPEVMYWTIGAAPSGGGGGTPCTRGLLRVGCEVQQ